MTRQIVDSWWSFGTHKAAFRTSLVQAVIHCIEEEHNCNRAKSTIFFSTSDELLKENDIIIRHDELMVIMQKWEAAILRREKGEAGHEWAEVIARLRKAEEWLKPARPFQW